MTREEAIKIINCYDIGFYDLSGEKIPADKLVVAFDMAIEALQFVEHFDLLKEYQSLQEVVQCKDCQHASECDKSVQYRRNELNTVSIGYLPIEWCSRGERNDKTEKG